LSFCLPDVFAGGLLGLLGDFLGSLYLRQLQMSKALSISGKTRSELIPVRGKEEIYDDLSQS